MKSPILFDLDGTITDPAPGFLASIHTALAALGEAPRADSELTQYIGPPLRDTFAILLGTEDTTRIEEGVERYRDHLNTGGKFNATVYPGMRELLETLHHEGYHLFVATGKPREMATEIIEHFELTPFFEKVYGAELDGRFVDKAELIAHLYGVHSLPKGAGVMIGDTKFDIRAGRLNGLKTVGVTWGYGTNEALESEQVDRIVENSDALSAAIRNLAG